MMLLILLSILLGALELESGTPRDEAEMNTIPDELTGKVEEETKEE